MTRSPFAIVCTLLLSTSSLAQTDMALPPPPDAPEAPDAPDAPDAPGAPAAGPPGPIESGNTVAPSPVADVDPRLAAPASTVEPARVVDETTLEDHRTPLQALNEHFLGSASRPVRFDWRRANVAVVARINDVIERNSFGQWQIGLMARKAFGDILLDGGVNAFFAYETPSSEQLALTPFRQAGRPNHFQLEANVGYAVAEGVVTPVLGFLPPAELVLVGWAGARYLVYVESFTGGGSFTDVAASLVSPQLSEGEIIRLENSGPSGMQIDRARLHTLVGASLDIYLQPGVVVAPRAMVAVPLLAPVTGTELGFFWELGISVGYAF